MNNKWFKRIRITGFLLSGILLMLSLSACAEIRIDSADREELFLQIEEASCTKKEAVYLLMEEKAAYEQNAEDASFWDSKIGDITMSDYIKEVTEDKLTRYTAAEVMSDRLAAYPSEDAKNLAGEEAVTSWTKLSGMYDMDAFGITASDVNSLYYKKAVYEAVYDTITSEAVAEITEDSTRILLADYALIPLSAGEESAAAVLESIRNGEDLSVAAAPAGGQVMKEQMIKRGELPSAVDTIAFALVDGEWSEVIECKDGFYIIHCIDDQLLAESAANYNEIYSKTKEEAFKEAYYSFSEEAKLWIDRNFFEKLDVRTIQ